MTPFDIETILRHYMICALWSSNDESDESGGDPMDANYDLEDIAPESVAEMREDVTDFVRANTQLLLDSGQSEEQIGHDFWLTRNGHGAGFWDRGLGEVGDRLSEACKPYGEVNLYVGDDGKVYQ
jgi:hypothetical protein